MLRSNDLWVIPYQMNKKNPDPHEIWHRYGLYKETFSHQNLADSTDLPLRYDHLNFILKYYFSLLKWP